MTDPVSAGAAGEGARGHGCHRPGPGSKTETAWHRLPAPSTTKRVETTTSKSRVWRGGASQAPGCGVGFWPCRWLARGPHAGPKKATCSEPGSENALEMPRAQCAVRRRRRAAQQSLRPLGRPAVRAGHRPAGCHGDASSTPGGLLRPPAARPEPREGGRLPSRGTPRWVRMCGRHSGAQTAPCEPVPPPQPAPHRRPPRDGV